MAPGSNLPGPTKVSLIPAAIVYLLFSLFRDQGFLMGLRRQYNLALCGRVLPLVDLINVWENSP